MLNHDAIALLSPLGYSPAGELFSVSASEVAENGCGHWRRQTDFPGPPPGLQDQTVR
jgi:hypothetical protein